MSWDLFWRGVQVAGGTLEVIGGGAMAGVGALGAPVTGGTSLLATVGGAAIGAHGVDQIYAGLTGTPSVASRLGGAAAAAVLGPDYAYIGEFLGDLGPGAAGVWKGVKSLPQLFKNLRSIPGKMKSFIDDLRGAGKLSQTLKGLPDEEIAEMLKRGEITDKDLIEAGLDPAKYRGGAKSTKSLPTAAAKLLDEKAVKDGLSEAANKSDIGGANPKEQGGSILRDPKTGEISTEPWPEGKGSSISIPVSKDGMRNGKEIIGSYHTHPNVGPDWNPAPSTADISAMQNHPTSLGQNHFVVSKDTIYHIDSKGTVREAGATSDILGK